MALIRLSSAESCKADFIEIKLNADESLLYEVERVTLNWDIKLVNWDEFAFSVKWGFYGAVNIDEVPSSWLACSFTLKIILIFCAVIINED